MIHQLKGKKPSRQNNSIHCWFNFGRSASVGNMTHAQSVEEERTEVDRSARVRPIALHGSECWTINKEDEEKLRIFDKEKSQEKLLVPLEKMESIEYDTTLHFNRITENPKQSK
ncbi:hypothetical protein TNCV_164101 [Trichonephila clavipes]|nr:hypothetical protein TNCV_164101 [Trichonephila clavipes]